MAKKEEKTQKRIDFLKYVGDEYHGTLNAGIALGRVEQLLDDIGRVKDAISLEPEPTVYHHNLPPAIISFYSVGFVTCLEWHARSRLCDLFNFKPEAIEDKDLEKDFSAKIVAQLIRENASITQYVAATRNYSTPDAYLGAISRLFDELGITPSIESIFHNNSHVKDLGGRGTLDQLYEFRNALVHEINRSHVDHPILRDDWSFKEAETAGSLVKELIGAIEKTITDKAPTNFPNRLIWGSAAESADEVLVREIEALEAEFRSKVQGFDQVCIASTYARVAEEEFLSGALPHLRWIDTKAAPRRALLRGRLAYLKALRNELGEVP